MSNFGYDFPIFNWFHSSDPLGTIYVDSCDSVGETYIDWDLTVESPKKDFPQLVGDTADWMYANPLTDAYSEPFYPSPPLQNLPMKTEPATSAAALGPIFSQFDQPPMCILSQSPPSISQSTPPSSPIPVPVITPTTATPNPSPLASPTKALTHYPSHVHSRPIPTPTSTQYHPLANPSNPVQPIYTTNSNLHYYYNRTGDPMEADDDGPFPEENSSSYEENNDSSFEKELSKVKLQASKSPIMDALVYCALNRWGIELLEDNGDNIRFRVLDFQKYYKYSAIICAKQNPTEDIASRIKALKRWFPDFPTKRAGNLDEAFDITVQLPTKQDNKPQKLHEIIEKQRRVLGLQKVTRQG
jgi:hypothetical protein